MRQSFHAHIVAVLLLSALCSGAEADDDAREAPSPPMSVMMSVEQTGAAGIIGTNSAGSSTEFAIAAKWLVFVFDADYRDMSWSRRSLVAPAGWSGTTEWGSLTRIAPGVQYYQSIGRRWAVWGKFAGIAGFEDNPSRRSVTWSPQLVVIRTLKDGTLLYCGAGSLYHRASKTLFPIIGVAWNTDARTGLSAVAAFPEAYARYRFSERLALRADYEWDTRVFGLAANNPTVRDGYLRIRDHFPALNVEFTPARKATFAAGVRWLGGRDVTIYDRDARTVAEHDVEAAWAFSLSVLLGS